MHLVFSLLGFPVIWEMICLNILLVNLFCCSIFLLLIFNILSLFITLFMFSDDYYISQASAYSLLQAASEISSRGDGRDGDINVFVQRRYQIAYILKQLDLL